MLDTTGVMTEGDDTMADLPIPSEGIVLTHFIVAEDVDRSRRFYSDVLGGETVMEGEPSIVQLANSWIIINVGGGPTIDKPDVILETPQEPTRASGFLNIRVADIQAVYDEWRSRGATFITEPQHLGSEIRCYMRDPDGHLIEVGQTTSTD
jgi:catechol 2,3-dioxygenase-like lactoylglutathione lyase family enzyme